MALQNRLVREAQQTPERQSPIRGPRPSYFGARSLEPQHPMPAREKWGYVFWGILGAIILITEAIAAFWDGFPVPTLSGTTGHLEQEQDWVKLIVLAGIVLLAARIALYPWPFRHVYDYRLAGGDGGERSRIFLVGGVFGFECWPPDAF